MHVTSHRGPRCNARAGDLPIIARARAFAGSALLAVACAAVPASAANPGAPIHAVAPQYASGHILVAPRAGLPDNAFQLTLAQHGGRSLGKLGKLNVHVVEVPVDRELDTVAKLNGHANVRFAELDRVVAPTMTPNDPLFASEWHLAKISAPTAWNTTQGASVTIAILDTGVDAAHPDLAANMVAGWNFYDNNGNTSDVYGHGTIVAGVAAAATNNSLGVAGVAGAAKIMPMRISDPTGYAYWSTVAQGLSWAADHGARVANISYQGVAASGTVQSAASYFRSKGGVVVVAAGNTGALDSTSPTNVMTVVSAIDGNDQIASWSTYGSFVDLAAPGVGVYSTNYSGSYGAYSGTSVASPVVAGTAALVLARRPDFGPAQVDSTLYASATDLGAAGTDIYYGHGRVNAAAAVALAATTTADTTPPTATIAAPTGGTVSGIVSVSVNATDNVGVARVDLKVNGSLVASDTLSPFQFSWDSKSVPNGAATMTAVAYDAAGNAGASAPVSLNVSNTAAPADTTPPTIAITAPGNGSKVSGTVTVSTTASDNSGASGITQLIYVDGRLVASGNGGSVSYRWNTRKAASGAHTISATARDAAGNAATATEQVSK